MNGSQDILLQYGALGVMVIAAFIAVRVMYIRLQQAYDREKERSDRLEEELRHLNETIRKDYIETINQATRAVADALAAVRGVSR